MIDHRNSKFSKVLLNDSEQSIDGHMMKFKSRSVMKQYIKSKPIKRSFKFWFCCSSKSDYVYQIDIYLGRKQTPEFGEEVVLQLTKDSERYYHFRGGKIVPRPSLRFLVLSLSSFTIASWVELILWTVVYHLDQKWSVRFSLCIYFDLMDIACVNSYLIYNMKHPNKLSPLDYEIVLTKKLI